MIYTLYVVQLYHRISLWGIKHNKIQDGTEGVSEIIKIYLYNNTLLTIQLPTEKLRTIS